MKLRIRYFASLREAFGAESEELELPDEVTTVGALRGWLAARGGVWAEQMAPGRPVRAAVQQRMVTADAEIVAGGEVAFFPPVTGG